MNQEINKQVTKFKDKLNIMYKDGCGKYVIDTIIEVTGVARQCNTRNAEEALSNEAKRNVGIWLLTELENSDRVLADLVSKQNKKSSLLARFGRWITKLGGE